MQLNHVRLNLPTHVTQTAVTTGNSLRISAQLNPEVFQQVYKDQITATGLTEEKAIALSIQPKQPLPAVHDILLRHLRA